MPEEPELPNRAVHLLISEDFFLGKVDAAARALERGPVVPDWDQPILEQIAQRPHAEMVMDLELDRLKVSDLLRELRQDPRTREMAILGYCSHNLTQLITQAQGLGVQVVARSTFAANLVRLMQELFRPASGAGEEPEE
ncbi:MAG: hypothetical protein ISR76_02650 [Planctomycetes bacterium]|nr:hypothetical protein [Planctomycetota bacterium]